MIQVIKIIPEKKGFVGELLRYSNNGNYLNKTRTHKTRALITEAHEDAKKLRYQI